MPDFIRSLHAMLGTRSCSDVSGHMTKMASSPIYGKNLQNSPSEPSGRWPWNLVYSIGYNQICSNDDPRLTLSILWQGQIYFLILLHAYQSLACETAI